MYINVKIPKTIKKFKPINENKNKGNIDNKIKVKFVFVKENLLINK